MSDSINRRNFIGTTAAITAAVGLSLASTQALAASSPNNKVVVGVMGLSRGASLADSYAKMKNVEVKYVCDIDSTRAASVAKKVEGVSGKAPQAIGDFRKILDDKQVDALVCAAPNHWHGPATILGCAAGKHVYVEKPCSHNPREGELMIEAARKYKRAVQVGTQRRSGDGWLDAIAKLHAGAIGKVYHVRAFYASARPSIGHGKPIDVPSHVDYELWQGPAPRRPYLSNVVHYNWHWRWMYGNGELGNNGVHTLDLCRWGANVDFPTQVTSSGGRYHWDDDQETPDTQTVSYEFGGKCQITWQGASCNKHRAGFVTFYGDQGTLDVDSNGKYQRYDKGDKVVEERTKASYTNEFHIANFLAAIRNDKPLDLAAEIAEGHKSTLLCHLGNISQRVGRSLSCDPQNGHILNDKEAMQLWGRDYEPGWEPKV
jgi:predicted dehydrogenase